MSIQLVPLSLIEVLMSVIWICVSGSVLWWFSRFNFAILFPVALGFGLRIAASLLHRVTGVNPEGRSDAVIMENRAWLWAQDGCLSLLPKFDPTESYVHSWIMSNFYACTERVPLLFQLSNVTLSMIAVVYLAKTASRMWSQAAGYNAAFIGSLFPTFILYSTVPLREAWVYVGLAIGLYFLVCWVQDRRVRDLIATFVFLSIPILFHGGMLSAFAAAAMFVFFVTAIQALRFVIEGWTRLSTLAATGLLVGFAVAGVLLMPGVQFSSIGWLMQEGVKAHMISESIEARVTGTLAYPKTPVIASFNDLFWSIPEQALRLLFGPFPWEVRNLTAAAVMLEAWVYLIFTGAILINLRSYIRLPEALAFICVLAALAVAFGLGTANYGTSMRHRAKLAGILIVLFVGRKDAVLLRHSQMTSGTLSSRPTTGPA